MHAEKKLDRKDNSIDELGTSNISKHYMHKKKSCPHGSFFLNPRFTCTKSHRIITSVQWIDALKGFAEKFDVPNTQ